MRTNLNESFNEICILSCIYIVMLFMLTSNLKFLDDMTDAFIFICAANIFNFAVQTIAKSIFSCFDKKKKNEKKKQAMKNIGN